jgi:hypothetical protein
LGENIKRIDGSWAKELMVQGPRLVFFGTLGKDQIFLWMFNTFTCIETSLKEHFSF